MESFGRYCISSDMWVETALYTILANYIILLLWLKTTFVSKLLDTIPRKRSTLDDQISYACRCCIRPYATTWYTLIVISLYFLATAAQIKVAQNLHDEFSAGILREKSKWPMCPRFVASGNCRLRVRSPSLNLTAHKIGILWAASDVYFCCKST